MQARALTRRQSVSECSRSSVSSFGSSPELAAIWLISASRASGTARRVDGRRRGLATFRGRIVGLGDQPVLDRALVQARSGG
jgi:hypothetical protein